MLKFVVLLVSADVVDGELDDDVTMVPPLTTLEDDAIRAAAGSRRHDTAGYRARCTSLAEHNITHVVRTIINSHNKKTTGKKNV